MQANKDYRAVLQQCEENEWKPISYASRFLTELEAKYSINELELFAVFWSVEHFKNYVYGVPFGIVTDHKAVQSVLKSNKGNKTYSSRLTRWVDRLLPFDFSIVHTPGRTLGMADYLSRHPSKYEGVSILAEKLFNDWFTVSVVDDITPNFTGLANSREPIGSRESVKLEKANVNRILTVLDKPQTNKVSEIIAKPPENELMAFNNELASSKNSNVFIQANAENERLIQKVISLVRSRNNAVIARLPPPWREKFSSFSVSENGLLYMDNRLVIPKDMRENVLRAIHSGHAGRDEMLREASDFWWPRVHREIVEKAKTCTECQHAGKNLKCVKSQNEFRKLPETHKPNEEIALDFAGPFQNANQKKKYLLVSVDNHFRMAERTIIAKSHYGKNYRIRVRIYSRKWATEKNSNRPRHSVQKRKIQTVL